ncbi:DUF6941 family protein [Pseudomonas typographi]|uniref:DUF6941 family protein n=1 Tax=Pseudomonas typographi TaxID=2715964 RepID=UPI0016890E25|nr:hypothetical protein [Pseudomonas typographi]MBD1589749.1 hypothetical protein [Pseudomonas typographi]
MKKKSPRHFLIVAEDIRPELNGKFSLMGIITSQIELDKEPDNDHAIFSIATYGEFDRTATPTRMHISLNDPQGNAITEGVLPVPPKSNKKLVLAGKFVNAKFKNSGTYSFSIKIDEDQYTKEFSVKIT